MEKKVYKMDELGNVSERERQTRTQITRELESLVAEKASIDKRVAAAADENDIKAMRKLRDDRDLVEDKIQVARAQLAKPLYLTRESVVNSFRAYADEYNEAFVQKKTEYDAARRELCDKWLELLRMQNTALKNQEMCDGLIFGPHRRGVLDPDAPRCGELDCLERLPKDWNDLSKRVPYYYLERSPDGAFFAACGYINRDEFYCAHLIQNEGRCVNTPEFCE